MLRNFTKRYGTEPTFSYGTLKIIPAKAKWQKAEHNMTMRISQSLFSETLRIVLLKHGN